MYTIYIPKTKGEVDPFEIEHVIDDYYTLKPDTRGVICVPGYMSKKKNIDEYWRRVFKNASPRLYISLTVGMTGEAVFDKNCNAIKRKYEYLDLGINDSLDRTKKDHSKMMFFYKVSDEVEFERFRIIQSDKTGNNEIIDQQTSDKRIEALLDAITVEGLLIGSSNQSYATFFHSKTQKGESDMMLIADNDDFKVKFERELDLRQKYDNRIDNPSILTMSLNKCVVAKSINFSSYEESVEYLKKIAKNKLLNTKE